MQILLKTEQETEGGQRYQSLAFGPDNIIAASHGSTLHFLDAKRGTVLEQIEVDCLYNVVTASKPASAVFS